MAGASWTNYGRLLADRDRSAVLRYSDLPAGMIPEHVLRTRTTLCLGATGVELDEAEARLGIALPPSYRAFLERSNGSYAGVVDQLREDGPDPVALLSTRSIDWARRRRLDSLYFNWFEAGDFGLDEFGRGTPERHSMWGVRRDEISYLTELDHAGFKHGQSAHCLTIGESDKGGTLLLNPLVADASGEWEVIDFDYRSMARFMDFEAWLEHTSALSVRQRTEATGSAELPSFDSATSVVDHNQRFRALDAAIDHGDVGWALGQIERLNEEDDFFALLRLGKRDEPAVWDFLERRVRDGDTPALMAAAVTSAPYVTEAALRLLTVENRFDYARFCLEIHSATSAGDALAELAEGGAVWALRSLARRQDRRALEPALALLQVPDPGWQLSGVEILRELRDPLSVPALVDVVGSSREPEIAFVAAHALAMTQVVDSLPNLRSLSALSEPARALVDRWVDQLEQLNVEAD